MNNIEILVVDDIISAAREYERLLRTADLAVASTDNPEVAIEIVEHNPVKVLVLDQRMPKMSGTELFRRLKKIDQFLQAIMLTGEASAAETADAFELGYSKFFDKRKPADALVAETIACYGKYMAAVAAAKSEAAEQTSLLVKDKWSLAKRHVIEVQLVNLTVLDDNYIFPETWWTERQVKTGAPEIVGKSTEAVNSYSLDDTSEKVLNASLGPQLSTGAKSVVLAELSGNLQKQVTRRLSQQYARQLTITETSKTKYHLPKESPDPEALSLRARNYQRAPLFLKFRAVLRRTCGCCSASSYYAVTGYLRRDMDATRTVDYYNNGDEKIVMTGSA